jgi:hypothetical protein
VLCPHASSTPPAPRFVNPPPGLFWPRRCLGHCTRLSTAHVSFFFFIVLPLLTPASLSLRAASALSCRVRSRAASVLVPRPFSCRVRSPVPLLHPHPRCINPPSPGLSWLHRRPDLCAPCRMPRSSSTPLHCTLCSACVVPPPPPTPLPRLMRASVSVPVRLYTCYFTCIRIRL